MYTYNKNTGSFQGNTESGPLARYPNEEKESSREVQEQRQKAAQENQAWLVRKFQMNKKLSSISSSVSLRKDLQASQAENGNTSSASIQLPKWLAIDAPKIAHAESFTEYIDEECQGFNHTVLRPTHGCQVNPDTLVVYCAFTNLRIDNSLIRMDRGGEALEDVMGRKEYLELPVYQKGAFSTRPKPNFEVPTEKRVGLHYLEDVLNNMKYPTKKNKGQFDSDCVETREGTTLMVTRYEYVNLYHTLTDWWNAFFVMTQAQKDRKEKVRLLFLDGHAKGNLDSVWEDVIGPYEYVQHLPAGGVCFERAVFISPGYSSTLFPDAGMKRERCPLRRLAEEFSSHFLKAYRLEQVKPIPGKVVIIDRQPYVSHPRSKIGNFKRVMLNIKDLEQLLRENPKVTSVEIVRFESMPIAEQIRAVRQAQILIGNHGAGLSHLMFMDHSSEVLEFATDYRDFFIYLSDWKDITYTPIPIVDETRLFDSELARTRGVVASILSPSKQYGINS
jgi:hypothetical protein